MGFLTLSVRVAGRRKPLVPDWQVPWPPDEDSGGESLTLRQLITRVVHEEARAFEKRRDERKLVRILTAKEMDRGLEKGRVDSGGHDLHQDVNIEEAVATALQAFEDGIYLVFIDDEEQRALDNQVFVTADSKLTFLRLVMLAGA